MTRFIAIVLAALRARVKPVSTIAKPACMNITRNAARSTQARFSAVSSDGGTDHLPRDAAGGAGGAGARLLSQTRAPRPRTSAATTARSTTWRRRRDAAAWRRAPIVGSRTETAPG